VSITFAGAGVSAVLACCYLSQMNAKAGVKASLEYLWSTEMEKAKCWPKEKLTRKKKKKNNPCIILNGVLITAGK